MSYKHLEGRTFINLIRCSTDEQADTSPRDQAKIMAEFGAKSGMIHVDRDVILEGVSASAPASRTDIDQIIKMKRAHDDFDVLLMQDFSRFTRGGIDHGSALKWELAQNGIEAIFVTFNSTGDMDQDALVQSIGFYAAQQWAKSNSYACTRGVMSSILAGNLPHTFRIPYGVDRLYVGADGVSRHRIRNMTDGTQNKLAVDSETVLATFGKNPKKGSPVHYRLQSDEKVLFVPGDPKQIDVVRRIYRMKLMEGKGTYLIARALNNEGIPSPTGKMWNTDTIESIVTNPTYTGVGIGQRYATGIYHVRGNTAAPQAVHRDLCTVAQRKKSDKTFRPKEEWRWQPHPLLANYLDESIRELAVSVHAKKFDAQHEKALAPKKKKKPGGDKHGDSPYILKGLLRSVQQNQPMTGTRSGPPKDQRRYYHATRAVGYPIDGSVFSTMIPAVELENAVLGVVRQVLLDVPNLRQHVERAVASQSKAVASDREKLEPLLTERDAVQANLEHAFTLGPATLRLMKPKMDQWESQLLALEKRIAEVSSIDTTVVVDVDAIVASTAAYFAAAAESLQTLPPAAIRTLLAALVGRLEVDLATRAVEMDLLLPNGVELKNLAANATDGTGPLCVVPARHWASAKDTQWLNGLKIASFRCQGQRGGRAVAPCYTCSRMAA